MYISIIEFIFLGIIVGSLTGILGSSGVVAVVPALIIINSVVPQYAIGTSLLIDVITSAIVAFIYYKNGKVDIKKGMPMIIGAIIGSQIGVRIAFSIPPDYIKYAFAVFILLTGIYSLLKKKDLQNKKAVNLNYLEIIGITIPVGLATGIVGASGGIMFLIISLIVLKLDIKTAVGTATFSMTISALSGSLGYLVFGKILLFASVIIGVVSIISGYYFAKIGNRLKPENTRKILGITFILIGAVQLIL
ncbi:sulfite exporter TauE/SafE family protein [Ferroplasma sp.]|uniref:sulfite exporter TauE/SafE family protein n=1 Tax=Ferroplasma sp. TaxID=2591003 RepID=UPI00307E49D7